MISRSMPDGTAMPGIGLGTFGSDKYSPEQVGAAVAEALDCGWRHFDCASVYGNEREVGRSLARALSQGLDRSELWVTSKVWNDSHDRVRESCEASLKALQLDALDLYLVHWPFPNHHAPGVDVGSRDPHAVPFSAEQFLGVWRQMEELAASGLTRFIGVSNMTRAKLRAVLPRMEIRPAAAQLELHPHFQQPELFQYLVDQGIAPIGYSPIGSPSRPERDRTPEDTVDAEDPAIAGPAARLGVHPAVVCVLWQVQKGSVPIPFSVKREQFEPMLRAVDTLRLTEDEMNAIAAADKGCRLIKGQVFLWPGANDWRDLWDGEA